VTDSGPYVFVSSAKKDVERAAPLLQALLEQGIPVRRLEELLDPASDRQTNHRRALQEAAAVLVVWSVTSRESLWVQQEAAEASDKVVPVTLDGMEAVPEPFRTHATVDLSGWDGDPRDPRVAQLGKALSDGLRRRTESLPLPERSPQPPRPGTRAAPAQGPPAPPGRPVPYDLAILGPSAREAVALADGIRQVQGRRSLHMEHLIEALFVTGPARQVFGAAGIDHDALREIIRSSVGTAPPPSAVPTELHEMPRLSRHVGDAVGNALRMAQQRSAAAVESTDLLRGALDVRACGLVTALAGRGVSPEAVDALRSGRREDVRWVADDPVGLDMDSLGRKEVARALDKQLRDLVTDFPGRSFLVHVDGAWGAGKSTLLRFVEELVALRPQGERWLTVEYDAWRQSRVGPAWVTLLHTLRSAVRETQGPWWRRGWFHVLERGRLVPRWQWVALAVVTLLLLLVTSLLALADGGFSLTQWGDLAKVAGGLLPIAGGVWLIASFLGRFLSLDSRRSAEAFLENRADPMEDLAAHFRWVLNKARRTVLLLIDDLDRCPEGFVVELLDAVQKLIRYPQPTRLRSRRSESADDPVQGLLIVVAADGRWIRQAYDNTFASLEKAVREPGATIGSLFVEKLFQITLPVPRLPEQLKSGYLNGLLDGEAAAPTATSGSDLTDRVREAHPDKVHEVWSSGSATERLEAAGAAIDKLIVDPGARERTEHALQPFGPLLEPTPRAMKRFVMAFSVLRAVRIAEGCVVRPERLALWTVVITRWPLLAEYLQDNPNAVRYFEVPKSRFDAAVPAEIAPLFTDPPDDLRTVMNHSAGPLNARTIRECCGELGQTGATPMPS
jgi:hypothetical protein